MCIACELGYWSMVDALEAEQSAKKRNAGTEADFACETPAERPNRAQRSSDEPAP
jgi:hypothetical protein